MKKSPTKSNRLVGKGMVRVDAGGKVRGATRYLNDLALKGILHGTVVRSHVPRGILKAILPDPSFDWSSVVLATARDVSYGELGRRNQLDVWRRADLPAGLLPGASRRFP